MCTCEAWLVRSALEWSPSPHSGSEPLTACCRSTHPAAPAYKQAIKYKPAAPSCTFCIEDREGRKQVLIRAVWAWAPCALRLPPDIPKPKSWSPHTSHCTPIHMFIPSPPSPPSPQSPSPTYNHSATSRLLVMLLVSSQASMAVPSISSNPSAIQEVFILASASGCGASECCQECMHAPRGGN
jgi:hypothetical protein